MHFIHHKRPERICERTHLLVGTALERHHHRSCDTLIVKLFESYLSLREIVFISLFVLFDDSISSLRVHSIHNHLGEIFSRDLRTVSRMESWSTCSNKRSHRCNPLIIPEDLLKRIRDSLGLIQGGIRIEINLDRKTISNSHRHHLDIHLCKKIQSKDDRCDTD